MNLLSEIVEGKVIQKNYGHIGHLPGSKMIDVEDHLLGKDSIEILINRRRNPRDIVIVTEKLDGMNCGVLKRKGSLYPMVRKGYDVRTNPYAWVREFATFVSDNANRFSNVLYENERLCGEWLLKTHTIQYDLHHEPFVAFDIINDKHQRENYERFTKRIEAFDFIRPGLVHIGEAIDPSFAMKLLGAGYHGAIEGPEGVVYRYERWDEKESVYKFECMGKFVANPIVGNDEFFRGDDPVYNKLRSRFKKYIKNVIQ